MTAPLHAPILWAQRDNILYVTIAVEEAKVEELAVNETSLHFKFVPFPPSHSLRGTGAKGEQYETSFDFYAPVDGEKFRRYGENTRFTELIVPKKEAAWWPRLLKDKGKVGWLKVNFDKWVDEDEQDDEAPAGPGGDFDLSQYMSQMGAGGNMPPDLDGFDGDDDEDDDDVPDLEDADDEKKADGEKPKEENGN